MAVSEQIKLMMVSEQIKLMHNGGIRVDQTNGGNRADQTNDGIPGDAEKEEGRNNHADRDGGDAQLKNIYIANIKYT